MKIYALLADILTLLHVIFVASVAFGQLAILIAAALRARWIRNPWIRGIHLTMAVIVAFEAVIDYECPLTTLEYELRVDGGQVPANFRQIAELEVRDLSFIGRILHALVPSAEWTATLHYVFMGFGALVIGSILIIPPRKAATIVALDVCCLAVLYVCWHYAGQPRRWGVGAWDHGVLVCVWNALPFVIAGGIALCLRDRFASSLFLCGTAMLQCAIGLLEFKSVRATAGESGLSTIEWLLPLAHFAFMIATTAAARFIGTRQPAISPAVEGAAEGGSA